MPRYFFDLFNDIQATDPEGRELPDLAAAQANAVREVREMMSETVGEGRLDLRHYVQVRDEAGQTVAVVRFGDAVEIIYKGDQKPSRAELRFGPVQGRAHLD